MMATTGGGNPRSRKAVAVEGGPMGSTDDRPVRAIAVTSEDVVAAHEHNCRNDSRAVLRMTPPFHGRMRARLHVVGGADYDQTPAPVHVPPEDLLAEDVPALPRADDTRERAATEYDVEDHRERHVDALERWRETVATSIRDRAAVETPAGRREVDVVVLERSD